MIWPSWFSGSLLRVTKLDANLVVKDFIKDAILGNYLIRGTPNRSDGLPAQFQHKKGKPMRREKEREEKRESGEGRKGKIGEATKGHQRPAEASGGPSRPPKLHLPP